MWECGAERVKVVLKSGLLESLAAKTTGACKSVVLDRSTRTACGLAPGRSLGSSDFLVSLICPFCMFFSPSGGLVKNKAQAQHTSKFKLRLVRQSNPQLPLCVSMGQPAVTNGAWTC